VLARPVKGVFNLKGDSGSTHNNEDPLHLAKARFEHNIARCRSLLRASDNLPVDVVTQEPSVIHDMTRAIIVFAHAAVDDFLRCLANYMLLQTGTPDAFASMSAGPLLPGSEDHRKPTTLTVQDLAGHRGKSVNQLLQEAVAGYVEHLSFNDTTQIASLIERIGVKVEPYRKYFKSLDLLFSRRHIIVHRADMQDLGDREPKPIANEEREALFNAIRDAIQFADRLEKDARTADFTAFLDRV
jgi:hypothetical protein